MPKPFSPEQTSCPGKDLIFRHVGLVSLDEVNGRLAEVWKDNPSLEAAQEVLRSGFAGVEGLLTNGGIIGNNGIFQYGLKELPVNFCEELSEKVVIEDTRGRLAEQYDASFLNKNRDSGELLSVVGENADRFLAYWVREKTQEVFFGFGNTTDSLGFSPLHLGEFCTKYLRSIFKRANVGLFIYPAKLAKTILVDISERKGRCRLTFTEDLHQR